MTIKSHTKTKFTILMAVIISLTLSTVLFSTNSTYAQTTNVPNWFKGTAGFWAEGKISTEEFVDGVEFLLSQNIIQVPSTAKTEGEPPEPRQAMKLQDMESKMEELQKQLKEKETLIELLESKQSGLGGIDLPENGLNTARKMNPSDTGSLVYENTTNIIRDLKDTANNPETAQQIEELELAVELVKRSKFQQSGNQSDTGIEKIEIAVEQALNMTTKEGGRNPQTGKEIKIAVKFKPGSDLSDAVSIISNLKKDMANNDKALSLLEQLEYEIILDAVVAAQDHNTTRSNRST